MYERERRLQTDLSWPADFIPRGLDGLEGLLMSGATGQISEVDRGHAPKREPSPFTLDPFQTPGRLDSLPVGSRSARRSRT
jgi:hypothetical protein